MATNMIAGNEWFTEGATDTEFITAHEVLDPMGRIHAPVSSADILKKFREKAKVLGLNLINEKGALKKDGRRFMYLADVEDPTHPEYALSVGFRNHSDTSLAFSGMCGNHIFVCENGVCTSIVKPSKMRHTIGNVQRNTGILDSKIDAIFSRFIADRSSIHGQIDTMKATKLTDEIVGKFIRKMNGEWRDGKFRKNAIIGSANLMHILEELENPTLNSHNDDSVFRLMNAASYVTTHKMRNPTQGLMASREINNTIMGIIKPDFIPLGDVVEAEVED